MIFSEKTKRKFAESLFRTKTCWLWYGTKDHRGYGRFYVPELQKNVRAHRFLYELKYGPVPDGLELHHKCRRRICVRPSHLQAVTHKENSQFAAEAGAWRGEKNGNTDKEEEDVVAIIILHEYLNVPVKTIVMATGIPERTIYSYLNREAWAYVRPPSAQSERDEFLQAYIDGDLPGQDSPFSYRIRSLL